MSASPGAEEPVIVLLGNYPVDRQESMLRLRDLIQSQLEADGYSVESIFPRAYVGALTQGPLAKWLGYVDKYILFPSGLSGQLARLKRKYPGRKIVVHICDHSNAVYAGLARRHYPVFSMCNDLLAVRGALGEDTDCPASGFGKRLQVAILRGLGQANYIACISAATRSDLLRLLGPRMEARSEVVYLGPNYPYRPLSRDDAMAQLSRAGLDLPYRGYVLHVGSALRRKNREALLRSVAEIKDSWPGQIVFAGERVTPAERALAASLGISERMREVSRPDNETLMALYAAAHCLIFMSRFEGLGWPLLEAQAAGCPVICSNRTSVPEVVGEGAMIHEPDDYAGIAGDILRLQVAGLRESLVAAGLKNAPYYSNERMMGAFKDIYRRIE
jgi:glycosyltransferase involved in cell wall biosynthesis